MICLHPMQSLKLIFSGKNILFLCPSTDLDLLHMLSFIRNYVICPLTFQLFAQTLLVPKATPNKLFV